MIVVTDSQGARAIANLYPADRIETARQAAAAAGLDALLVSPGADLRYLTGYHALPLERLTALVVPVEADPVLIVPALEKPAAAASPVGGLGIEILGWAETDDPYALVAERLPAGVKRIAIDDHMWAEKVLALRAALPQAEQSLAGEVLRPLRARKSPAEVEALRRAGAAIDRVHRRMGEWLRPGRTEREVARDIADAIVEAGHATCDFVIVGAGPNSASPHHEVSDRPIRPGEPVVVDIGGTTHDGYCSDSTRTYAAGEPHDDFRELYAVLQRAQQAQTEAVRPGITAQELDAVGRDIIEDAGYGDHFIHRTGHGIGLETHEEPYIVAGSEVPLEPGMAFSIEPGIYLPGRFGARIEDIAVCTEDGGERLNLTGRDLVVLPG
ncbi:MULTISPECIES: M24 family metallopeptidase [Streptomycetaceae]|uniref:Peptidase M24 n=1 Tax=Streptantibioticus cattleyicolor (strain ATCC 35852 / DSM 46488 / JCM 4925 / NBRC 14057 / NRRL 8057) TaxID=1003195 RepID=F8JPI3_STREN|nr:Xaa-Pro peptidase family protein [Streptantibioticus cattleyicolor]AEW97752.1 peptidase M24 [Streptantibioticus cattleyicolor NRRL 8057 = DSM 46488]MYS62174.1 M24 family metallopeptidase [Streptomyces sp. SID5468]CCB78070.1 putative dipeptidase pepE [Streptantibioticus cattleyicolor NRRL 8057 = DSM 46488]